MADTFEAPDWNEYTMDYREPHKALEPAHVEINVVDAALQHLVEREVIPHSIYDRHKFQLFRDAVRRDFEIPWTAITPRMQRFLYAVNAIAKPKTMVAVGIFCGFTFISNAGAAIGPGASYQAKRVVGIEIKQKEAELARRNVLRFDASGGGEIVADDGLVWLKDFEGVIDLLYLDANGAGRGKSIYLDMLKTAEASLRPGSIVLAHNSANHAAQLSEYLSYMRDGANFRESVNVVIDPEGVEVSLR